MLMVLANECHIRVRICFAFAHIIPTCSYSNYIVLLLACIDDLSLLSAPWAVSIHTCEREIFALLVAWVVLKVYDETGAFLHILCLRSMWNNCPITARTKHGTMNSTEVQNPRHKLDDKCLCLSYVFGSILVCAKSAHVFQKLSYSLCGLCL